MQLGEPELVPHMEELVLLVAHTAHGAGETITMWGKRVIRTFHD